MGGDPPSNRFFELSEGVVALRLPWSGRHNLQKIGCRNPIVLGDCDDAIFLPLRMRITEPQPPCGNNAWPYGMTRAVERMGEVIGGFARRPHDAIQSLGEVLTGPRFRSLSRSFDRPGADPLFQLAAPAAPRVAGCVEGREPRERLLETRADQLGADRGILVEVVSLNERLKRAMRVRGGLFRVGGLARIAQAALVDEREQRAVGERWRDCLAPAWGAGSAVLDRRWDIVRSSQPDPACRRPTVAQGGVKRARCARNDYAAAAATITGSRWPTVIREESLMRRVADTRHITRDEICTMVNIRGSVRCVPGRIVASDCRDAWPRRP